MIQIVLVLLSRIWATARFYISYPFVVVRFKWLEWRRFRTLVPTRWFSSGELIRHDLENLEGEIAKRFFNEENLQLLSSARDSLSAKIISANRLILTVFVFLIAQYVSIELDVSIFGVSIKKAPGVTEALLCFLILSEFMVSIVDRTKYFIESTMKIVIDKITPPEIIGLVRSRYFPFEQFGPYQPFNLPHIVPNAFLRFTNINTAIFYLIAIIAPALFLFYAGHILLIYNMWAQPQLGKISKLLSVYLFFVLILNIVYSLLVRVRMPYRDWSHNQLIELTKQFHPQFLPQHYDEAWGDLSRERRRLLDLGYSDVDIEEIGPLAKVLRLILVVLALIVTAAILTSP